MKVIELVFVPFNVAACILAKFGRWSPYRYKDRSGFVVAPGGKESILYESDGLSLLIVGGHAASPVLVFLNSDGSLEVEEDRSTPVRDLRDWAIIRRRLESVVRDKWNGSLEVREVSRRKS